jgi:hypothetical protein
VQPLGRRAMPLASVLPLTQSSSQGAGSRCRALDSADAERAATIARLHARDDAVWLAELLMDLEGEEG